MGVARYGNTSIPAYKLEFRDQSRDIAVGGKRLDGSDRLEYEVPVTYSKDWKLKVTSLLSTGWFQWGHSVSVYLCGSDECLSKLDRQYCRVAQGPASYCMIRVTSTLYNCHQAEARFGMPLSPCEPGLTEDEGLYIDLSVLWVCASFTHRRIFIAVSEAVLLTVCTLLGSSFVLLLSLPQSHLDEVWGPFSQLCHFGIKIRVGDRL